MNMIMVHDNERIKPTYWERSSPSALLSPRNPTWIDLGTDSGLRAERPATNSLHHDVICTLGGTSGKVISRTHDLCCLIV